MTIEEWKAKGEFIQIGSNKLFVIDTKEMDKEPLLILHGFPTSSFDFNQVWAKLSENYRLIIHDHLGFGYSSKPKNFTYSLVEQADYALLVWEKIGINSGHILAHDYGTSVTTEILARINDGHCSFNIKSLCLCNGSMHIELAKLRPIQRLLGNKFLGPIAGRFASKALFFRNMKRIWANPKLIDSQELNQMWELMIRDDGRKVVHLIAQYIHERYLFWDRWIGALRNYKGPSHVLWGLKDPIARTAIAEALLQDMPQSVFSPLPELGHYPMLENPTLWSENVIRFLERV